jgi:hypothetical protein
VQPEKVMEYRTMFGYISYPAIGLAYLSPPATSIFIHDLPTAEKLAGKLKALQRY